MANISFEGIGALYATFEAKGVLKEGAPCKVGANDAAQSCSAGDNFCGVASADSSGGTVSVQLRGFVTVTYTGTAPTLGYCALVADGTGKVKVSSEADARSYLVANVNSTAGTVCILL